MTHKANLDILRAVAVSLVFLDHLTLTLHSHFGVLPTSRLIYPVVLGEAGVLAFFVHTSLVLMQSLERMARSGGTAWTFYLRRFFRIYPLAIGVIVLTLVLRIPQASWAPAEPIRKAVVVANLLLVQNIWTRTQVLSPLWSLPFEVQMYVVLPALFLVTKLRRASAILAVLFVVFCGIGTASTIWGTRLHHVSAAAAMIAYVPCFLCGVLSYSLRGNRDRRIPAVWWLPFLIGVNLVFVVGNGGQRFAPAEWSTWAFCLVLGVSLQHFEDSRARYLNRAAERLATYSYGCYLLHVPALYLIFGVLHWPVVTGSVAAVVLTGGFSFVAYHLIEHPFIRLGTRLSKRLPVGREADQAASMGSPQPAPVLRVDPAP